MAEETDGVREAFDDALRIALTVAIQLGEKVARLREQLTRQREGRAVQTNRELESRFEAERGAMRASLLPLQEGGWWERATVTDIANARETAVAWRDYDDVARKANDTILVEVHDRYRIDVSLPGADQAEVAEALRTAENERAKAAADRQRDGQELAAADVLLLAADRRDLENARGAQTIAEIEYDSAARREEFAASLTDVAAPETIAARILADGENARHPSEAIATGGSNSSRVRRSSPSTEQQRLKSGLSR